MTQTEKHIDHFFNSVIANTIELKEEELHSLLEKRSSDNRDRKSLQKSLPNEDRVIGFKTKGIILMTLIAIGITAFLLASSPTLTPVKSVDNIKPDRLTTAQGLAPENQAVAKPAFANPVDSIETSTAISPIPLVELSDAALLKLGVYRKSSNEILCYQDFGSKKYLFEVRYTQKPFGLKATIIDKNEAHGVNEIPSFLPVQMTNLKGIVGSLSASINSEQAGVLDQISIAEFNRLKEIEKFLTEHPGDPSKVLSKDDQALLQKVIALKSHIREKSPSKPMNPNSLIPIVVRTNASSENEGGFILWYQPTQELLNVIKGDRQSVVTKVSITSNDIFFGISIFPNPAHGDANLQFQLRENRSVRVDLQDITGKQISIVSRSNDLSAGKHEIKIQTQDLSSGIYIVLLTTDKGERSIQRLVIEK